MRELINKLNYYTKCYDSGHPEISDTEWDRLYFELAQKEKETGIIYPDSPTQTVNYEVKTELEKVKHNHPMLSLAKTKDWGEFLDYFYSINAAKNIDGMLKLDGLTCSLRYIDGELVSAETRGNGLEGENILHNAKIIPSIPNKISYKNELIIDGEIICTYSDFETFKDEYSTPRNFAAGSIRLLNAKESANRNLTFVAWNIIKGYDDDNSHYNRLANLKKIGFTIVPITNSFDDDAKEYLINQAEELGYPIDGLVGKFDDLTFGNSLGATGHHMRSGFAFKFADDEYETNLKSIEYEVSRTGVLTPVAVFEPVDIDGTIVERASLSNISILYETLGLYPEVKQTIKVFKANEIIPQLVKGYYKNDIENDKILSNVIPSNCPCCGQATQIITSDAGVKTLVCSNDACPSKIVNIIDHYCSRNAMNIKGLSKATLEKLLDWGWINDIKDIYELKNHKSEWIRKSGFGTASVTKVLDSIEKSRYCKLNNFLVALGIPLVGNSIAKEITKKFNSWTEFLNSVMKKYNYSTLPNFGIEISNSILNFDYEQAIYIANNYLTFEVVENEEKTDLANITFVITGSLKHYSNRNEIKELIESLGGKVAGSVSKNTNYLINNDKESGSSKNLTAKKLNIPIISEEDFIEKFLK